MGHHAVDQPHLEGAPGIDAVAGEEELQGVTEADHARRPHGADDGGYAQ